jgi:hypothetical protein
MTQSWKHDRPAVDNSFQRPKHDCYACHDTGIVHNSDGRLDEYMPGYDQRFDKAVICTCKASWPSYGDPPRPGYRTTSGVNEEVGISASEGMVKALDEARRASWAQTKIEIDYAREMIKEDPSYRPEFMKAARANIDRTGWASTSIKGLSSLGDCLVAVTQGIAQGREVEGRERTPLPEGY